MSADRYEILDDGALTIAIKLGENTQYVDELEDDFVVGAIRQQTRDLEIRNEWYANALNELDDKRSEITKLRAELAAAVASIEDDFSGWRAVERRWKTRAEQAEARLAAIDGAPTVAYVNSLSQAAPNYLIAELLPPQDRPPIGTELIARPPKGI